MRVVLCLVLTLAAFTLGAWSSRAPTARPLLPALAPVPDATAARSTASAQSPGAADDERWTRLLSALQEPLRLHQRALLAQALGDWTASDLTAAIDRARKLPLRFRSQILHALVSRWFELDAESAAQWVQCEWPRDRNETEYLRIWAAHDRDAALRALLQKGAYFTIGATFQEIVGENPYAVARTLAALPASAMRDDIFHDTMRDLAHSPEELFAFAAELPAGTLREIAHRAALLEMKSFSPEAVATARALLPQLTPSLNGNTFNNRFTARLAESDPAEAREWVAQLPAEFRLAAATVTAHAWAKAEPIAALKWARAQGLDLARNFRSAPDYATGTILSGAMLAHPDETTAWLLALPAGEERARLLEAAASQRLAAAPRERPLTGREKWLRDLYREMPAEGRARVERRLGGDAANLRAE